MSNLTDENFLLGLRDDIVKAINAYGLRVKMHETAEGAKIAGKHEAALTFNTVSFCTKETFLAILARVLDQDGGGSLHRAKHRRDIQKPTKFGTEVHALQTCEAGKKLRQWRNGILSHKDGESTASEIAAKADLKIFDDCVPLLKDTFILIGGLFWANEKCFGGLPQNVGATLEGVFDAYLKDAFKSGEILTRKLFDLKDT